MTAGDAIRNRIAVLGLAADTIEDLAHAARVRGLADLALRFESAAQLHRTEIEQLAEALKAAEALRLARAA